MMNDEILSDDLDQDRSPAATLPAWYREDAPAVSVIIPNYNKTELLTQCLQHLWQHTAGTPYEIIVVDNGSDATSRRDLHALTGPFRLIELRKNRFFGEASNIGVEEAKGEFIVLLNNDAMVTEGWLPPLLQVLKEAPLAGGVGPKFLYPDGRLQEAGAFMLPNSDSLQVGKFTPDFDQAAWDRLRIVDYCSAACFAMRKSLFTTMHGFDVIYEPAYYEDADLAFRLAAEGHLIYYCPFSVVHHVESATSKEAKLDHALGANKDRFAQRWGDYLALRGAGRCRRPPRGWNAVAAKAPSSPRGTCLIEFPFDPGIDIPTRQLLAMIAALSNYTVTVAFDDRFSLARMQHLAREFGVALPPIGLALISALEADAAPDVFVCYGRGIRPEAPGRGKTNVFIPAIGTPADRAEPAAEMAEAFAAYDLILVSQHLHQDLPLPAPGGTLQHVAWPCGEPDRRSPEWESDARDSIVALSLETISHERTLALIAAREAFAPLAPLHIVIGTIEVRLPPDQRLLHHGLENGQTHFYASPPPSLIAALFAGARWAWLIGGEDGRSLTLDYYAGLALAQGCLPVFGLPTGPLPQSLAEASAKGAHLPLDPAEFSLSRFKPQVSELIEQRRRAKARA